MSENWDELTTIITEGIQECLTEIESKYPDEEFYVFAVSNYPYEFHPIDFHGNSKNRLRKALDLIVDEIDNEKIEHRIQELVRIFGADRIKARTIRKTKKREAKALKFDTTWNWFQWLELDLESRAALAAKSHEWLDDKFDLEKGPYGKLDERAFAKKRALIEKSMLTALKTCRAKGLFKAKNGKDLVVYICGDIEDQFEVLKNIKKLNPFRRLGTDYVLFN